MSNTIELQTRFGSLQAEPHSILHFPKPLLGFEGLSQFTLLRIPEYQPFVWLQSLEEPGLAFPLLDPDPYFPGYSDQVCSEIQQDATVLCLVTRQQGVTGMNLLAPLVIADQHNEGSQIVLEKSNFDTFHPLERVPSC